MNERERLERDLRETAIELQRPLPTSVRPQRVRYTEHARLLLAQGWHHRDGWVRVDRVLQMCRDYLPDVPAVRCFIDDIRALTANMNEADDE